MNPNPSPTSGMSDAQGRGLAAACRPRWGFTTRVAFRFFSLYLGLYILLTQMLPSVVPFWRWGVLSNKAIVNTPVFWIIRHVFHDTRQLAVLGGSGDKKFDWVFTLTLLVVSVVVTAIWSVLDRKRPNYTSAHAWVRLYIRLGLAGTMMTYGIVKFVPLQMPAPSLSRLLEPFGNFSPMGVLWASVGASSPYERLLGSAELLAAALLFIPYTAALGAIVSLFDTLQVFALNMTYDVPVKLLSFHLVLMSLFLLAPDIKRLLNVVILKGYDALFPRGWSPRFTQAAVALQVVLGAYLFATGYLQVSRSFFATIGPAAPKPSLYGIWNIEKMTIDGVERLPLVTDYDRWRRVLVDGAATQPLMVFWRMDDSLDQLPASIDTNKGLITLTQGPPASRKVVGSLMFKQLRPETLVLSGDFRGKAIRMETVLLPRDKFMLTSRGFHWIQELPFNR